MFRKMLLTTTALVVASSIALAAAQQGKLTPAQQVERAKRVTRHAFEQNMPGVIFDRKHGIPMAIRPPPVTGKQSGASNGARLQGGKALGDFSKGKNARFLSYFGGWFAGRVNISYNSSSSYCISYNSNYTVCYNREHIHDVEQVNLQQSAAGAFKHVSTASAIALEVQAYSGTGPYKAAIYKDASGLPGTRVAGAGGKFSAPSISCSCMTTVNFPSVPLKKHKQYWVVVNGTKKEDGRLVWNAQESQFPAEIAFNGDEHVKYKDSYRTTKSGHTSVSSGSYNTGTGGWINTTSFTYTYEELIFQINGKA